MARDPNFDEAGYHARQIKKNIEAAQAAFDAGFAAEARRKEAQASVSRAYYHARQLCWGQLLDDFPAFQDADGVWQRAEPFAALDDAFPFDLHLWRPKHAAILANRYPLFVALVSELSELRAAIKEAMVEPKPVREDHPLLIQAREAAGIDPAKLRQRYEDTLDLGRKLKGLPVSVHRVFCSNYAGSRWIRLDWYLRGRRTPFSIIAAAYDTLVREGTIKEDD